jgi:hypothetical protein
VDSNVGGFSGIYVALGVVLIAVAAGEAVASAPRATEIDRCARGLNGGIERSDSRAAGP